LSRLNKKQLIPLKKEAKSGGSFGKANKLINKDKKTVGCFRSLTF
jgi:hypothetical protein